MCSVTISGVEESDHGEWTCALSDNLSLDTVKDRVGLGVVVSVLSAYQSPVFY